MTQVEFHYAVETHYRPLRGYAMKLTRDTEAANDLVQDTMLKAFNNQLKFSEGTNLKGWLYTIMKNIFINNYRRSVNGAVVNDVSEENYIINSHRDSVNNQGESRILHREIMNAINSIPENLRHPFLLSFEGYKYEEIAQQTKVPLGTVKIRIHMARQRLKKILQPYACGMGYSLN